jgi:hypothetical protein
MSCGGPACRGEGGGRCAGEGADLDRHIRRPIAACHRRRGINEMLEQDQPFRYSAFHEWCSSICFVAVLCG